LLSKLQFVFDYLQLFETFDDSVTQFLNYGRGLVFAQELVDVEFGAVEEVLRGARHYFRLKNFEH
jgi:hypothetical protein